MCSKCVSHCRLNIELNTKKSNQITSSYLRYNVELKLGELERATRLVTPYGTICVYEVQAMCFIAIVKR